MSLIRKFISYFENSDKIENGDKKKDLKTLYDEVDFLIEKFMISQSNVPPSLKIEATINSLRRMFKKDFFDLCTIKDCAELLELKLSEQRIVFYRTQHCIYWKEMDSEFRDALIAMVFDDFRVKLNLSEEKQLCIEII